MAGYTKADFYSLYSQYAVDPDTNIRFVSAHHPKFPGEVITLKLHYHPLLWRRRGGRFAKKMIDSGLIVYNDRIVILGGGYGWLGEHLKELNDSLSVCSMDTSDYIHQTKNTPPDDELIEAIESAGYSIDDGYVGEFLYNKFSDSEPRAKIPVIHGTLLDNDARAAAEKALGGTITKVITEELFQILSDDERSQISTFSTDNKIGLIHIIDGVVM